MRGFTILSLVILFLVVSMLIGSSNEQKQFDRCLARWQGTYESHYTGEGGCRVRIHGQWVPESAVIIRD